MTSFTGTIATTARTGRARRARFMHQLAGNVGAAFQSLRRNVSAGQLGQPPELAIGRMTGARA